MRTLTIMIAGVLLSTTAIASNPPTPAAPLHKPAATIGAAQPNGQQAPAGKRTPPLKTVPNVTIGTITPVNPTDANEDTEPSIVVQRRNSVDYPIVAFMKFGRTDQGRNNGTPHVNAYSTADNLTKQLTVPNIPGTSTPYTRTADPVLAENVYTGGINPKTIYCAGTAYNVVADPNCPFSDNAVSMWYSSDEGRTWSAPEIVASESASSTFFLDKPAVNVSWDQNSLGTAYLAMMRIPKCNGSSTPSEIHVYRYDTTAHRFLQRSVPVTGFDIHGPAIVTDYGSGNVWLLYITYGAAGQHSTITVMRSSDQAGSFPTSYSFDAGILFRPSYDLMTGENGGGTIQARTTLAARYNYVDNSIGVVYHRHETNGQTTDDADVYFNRFVIGGTMHWDTPQLVTHADGTVNGVSVTLQDQWHPALDYDDYGNYVVTYYDRRNSGDNQYQLYATKIDAAGNHITGENDTPVSSYWSQITNYTPLFGPGNSSYSLGEYQDVWYWYGTWYAASILIPSTTGDPYIARITP